MPVKARFLTVLTVVRQRYAKKNSRVVKANCKNCKNCKNYKITTLFPSCF